MPVIFISANGFTDTRKPNEKEAPVNIKLFCAYGMSTDVLVQEMKKFAKEGDQIHAYNVNDFEKEVGTDCDVALFGPQARMYVRSAKKTADPLGIPVDVIDMLAYGRRDGQKVYQQAERMYAEAQGK